MEISKSFDAAAAEQKWYAQWQQHNLFRSIPDDREPFTIVIPPPNVTGVLHMGHMLNNTIQDLLVRRARMLGKNALWVPGVDHASIATEARVVAMLREKGVTKQEIGREKFLEHAWEWKEKYGGIILEQLKKLGASCDWERTRFTMEPEMSEAVIAVFIDLYNKGLVYRGARMINWDPVGRTAVSDEEVNYKEVQSKLYYVKYPIVDSDEFITIATTRPETILGDTGVCVHPDDERYKHLYGKHCIIPFVNRKVPVIFDEYITMDFGTGALKVTPAHDINDYNLGLKHNLEVIDVLDENGKLSLAAGYMVGEDRFAARKKISEELAELGLLVKTEDIVNKVGFSERTDAVIEPKISTQWFVRMKELAGAALDVVMNDEVKLIPEKYKNTYRHWMENVQDWCISRQLWWGQRIPAWYNAAGDFVVARTEEEAKILFKEKNPDRAASAMSSAKSDALVQDEDVLDTWFSSWLWPISVFDGIRNPGNPEINYYYPTSVLVTAPEILFFWVARMIMAGLEYRKEIPFKDVYLTGIVRDKQGRKMSKSLGNSPEPLDLISQYGADSVRVGMLLSSPAGNDLLFDETLCGQGRNFGNKIWNAMRLVKGWEVSQSDQPEYADVAVQWFEARLQQQLMQLDNQFNKYRISEALMTVYKLVWDDFCSWYLEMIKPAYQQAIDQKTYTATIAFFEDLLRLLHPFMPFISEEIWHLLQPRADGSFLMSAAWPQLMRFDRKEIENFETAKEVISAVRNFRKEKNIPVKEKVHVWIKPGARGRELIPYFGIIRKLALANNIEQTSADPAGAFTFMAGGNQFFIPVSDNVDVNAEREKLQKELEYLKGFLVSVEKKLGNEKFVANAKPAIIENEQKKKADAEQKIRVIEEQLSALGV